ncbi:hypothetical protein [Caldalkalibacillus salinus]|uniref:hypothetical protein n=1 Tax=Caldalkalibacillus salinus TaxID=2803787 RepID=UPI001920E2BA|nr:hypothetical protein [Caldalkalibacillus salinus]
MKRLILLTVLIFALAIPVFASETLLTGNGAPSGEHYNLQIIGVPKDKKQPMKNSDGNRIFVPLHGETNIHLFEGEFKVLDANGTDEDGAAFQLPNPDPDNTGVTEYSVYTRALGKPGGSATMTTCATDAETGDEYCSTNEHAIVRDDGQSLFVNASEELLYVYADTDEDGEIERYPLFSDEMEGYYWHYDNDGLKVAQLRFYQGVSTTVQ